MTDYSTIEVSRDVRHRNNPNHDEYYLNIRARLSEPKYTSRDLEWYGHHHFAFTWDHTAGPVLLFVELVGEKQSVLLRIGTSEGDRKSYDMVTVFRKRKADLMTDQFRTTVIYEKALLSSEYENFRGFFPFGLTLIQPAWESSSDITCSVFPSTDARMWSLRIHNRTFSQVRILGDIVRREVLSECTFAEERNH
jgi:hypothetical protein